MTRFITRYWGWLFILWFAWVMAACTPLACKHKRTDPVCKEETHDD